MLLKLALGIISGRITVVNVAKEFKEIPNTNPQTLADWMIHWENAQKWAEGYVAFMLKEF